MKTIARVCRYLLIALAFVTMLRGCFLTNVEPGTVGVRYNNAMGLLEQDLKPGLHWEILGLQRIYRLPRRFLFLNYAGNEALSIRTKDNNTVTVDVSVPYRILMDKAYMVMDAGNHLDTGNNRFRFERLANETTISVLRESLAQLQSQDFYDTDRRLKVAENTRMRLNKALKPLQLEASKVLIRAAYFRKAYERQLARIQFNEQQKLLDRAKKAVAQQQQKLDNYTQQTNAMAAALSQQWVRKIADLERAYQVGFADYGEDRTPGAARRALAALSEEQRKALAAKSAKTISRDVDKVSDAHLLGIKNIEAETSEYELRVSAAADGIAARLKAEGAARLAQVNADYVAKVNALLNTPGGRAYVAYQAAANVTFNETLTFQSSDGIPAVLRLGHFARQFMGK